MRAGGFAPSPQERPLQAPDLAEALSVVKAVLAAHEPFPAVAVDRRWNLVAANPALHRLVDGVRPEMLEAPVNMLRLSLSPQGLAPSIVNLPEWRAYVLHRLRREADIAADESVFMRSWKPTMAPHRRGFGGMPEA